MPAATKKTVFIGTLAAGIIGIAAFLISKTRKNKNPVNNGQTQLKTTVQNSFTTNNNGNLPHVYKDFTLK